MPVRRPGPVAPLRYRREGNSLEFERVAFFSDAVYAIALTLLVVGISVPIVVDSRSTQEVLDALDDRLPEFIAFAVGVAVIGRYWAAHHEFFSTLRAVDRGFIGWNLAYLGFVAFIPFPVGMIGRYEGNVVAFLLFAGIMATVSALEVVLIIHAHRARLFRHRLSAPAFRFALQAGLLPVAVILLSLPLGLANTTAALLSWVLIIPLERLLDSRLAPEVLAELERVAGDETAGEDGPGMETPSR